MKGRRGGREWEGNGGMLVRGTERKVGMEGRSRGGRGEMDRRGREESRSVRGRSGRGRKRGMRGRKGRSRKKEKTSGKEMEEKARENRNGM